MLGYDASEGSHAALETAIEACKAYGDRLLIVFGTAPPGRLGEEWRAHQAAIREHAERAVAPAVVRAKAAGIETEAVLEPADAAAALIAVADRVDARLIVVGTWGEPPLKAARVGSTPNKLLHLSERPVLVVPAPE